MTTPTFVVRLSSSDTARDATLLAAAEGNDSLLWGSPGAPRSILRLSSLDSRALGVKLHDLGKAAIATTCATDDKGPKPVVFRQPRGAGRSTLAAKCAIVGPDRELVFQLADSAAETLGVIDLPNAWPATCPAFAGFVDSLLTALYPAAADSTERPDALKPACPRVWTSADIDQLARRLLGGAGDSAAALLLTIGPRAIPAVMPLLGDIDPGARGRAARVVDGLAQLPMGELLDPNTFIVPLAQHWRDETDRDVADMVGRALGSIVTRNPGRIRNMDTLVTVLRDRLPALALRAKDVPAVDLQKAAQLQPLQRALDIVVALGENAGGLVATVGNLTGKYSPAVDVLAARAIGKLGVLANSAGERVRALVWNPLPQLPGPRTVASYGDAQIVAMESARALAATGPTGRQDLDSLWRVHTLAAAPDTLEAEIVLDSLAGVIVDAAHAKALTDSAAPRPAVVPDSVKNAAVARRMARRRLLRPGAAPTAGAVATAAAAAAADSVTKRDTALALARSSVDTALVRALVVQRQVARTWLTPAARGVLLDTEIRRQALVAGFGVACTADSAVTSALGRMADEKLVFHVAPPSDDPSVTLVQSRLVGERERTRVAALDALGGCGTQAAGQLAVIARLANAPEDSDVAPSIKNAARVALPKVRKID